MGAILSISADKPTTGRQAALLTQSILEGNAKELSVTPPAGSSITLNMDKVRTYKIKLNEDALDSVNNIVGE